MPKHIGLTGGIGSGKSTVARLFEEMGVPVFYSDDEAKKLYENSEVQHLITEAAGPHLFEHGVLNRPLLAQYIFTNPDLRATINGIIHPRVRENFAHFCEMYKDAPYVMNEAAILFETGVYKRLDKTILVVAPEEVKVARIMLRDHLSEQEVRDRMAAQWSDAEKIPLADFIIHNDGEHPLADQVMKINDVLSV